MTKEEIIDNIARLNSETWKDREEVRMEIGKLLSELKKALEQQPSDDCVSRQAVLDMAKSYNTDGYDSYTPLVVDVEDIEELPPVTPIQRWIPVSERLPEIGEKVLCQCQANIYDVLKLTVDGWYYDKNHCYMSGFVIAWQHLPKPYEERRGSEE